jgi:hypothetical protein
MTSPLNVKRDYQQFNVKARPIDRYHFLSPLVFAGQHLLRELTLEINTNQLPRLRTKICDLFRSIGHPPAKNESRSNEIDIDDTISAFGIFGIFLQPLYHFFYFHLCLKL